MNQKKFGGKIRGQMILEEKWRKKEKLDEIRRKMEEKGEIG